MELSTSSMKVLEKANKNINNYKKVFKTEIKKGYLVELGEKQEFIVENTPHEYEASFYIPMYCKENRSKFKERAIEKLEERKAICRPILQAFNFMNLAKNKINRPIKGISNFKQCPI